MKRFFLISFLLCLGFGLGFSQAPGQYPPLPQDPSIKRGSLPNGLTYYIRHNALPEGRAEFYLATNVGAIQETPEQDGLAHFLEHMCFNGTKNFPGKKILDYLQSIGASFGQNVNASTGVEQTVYMLNNIPLIDRSVIDTCILIMHDYSHFVLNDPAEIDLERGVIIEERRQRRNAAWRMNEKSLPYYFGDSKYATCTVIGTQENLQTFKPESLTDFYRTWYHPDMQAIIVVGDVDVDYVEAKIAEIFADIPKEENPKPKDVITVPENKEPVVGIVTDPETTTSGIEVLWKSPAVPEELRSTIMGPFQDALKSIITWIMGERFEDIAASPEAPFLNASMYIGDLCETMEAVDASVMFKEGATKGFEALMTEIERMKRYGFSEAELSRAKADILSNYESAAKKADTRKNAQLVSPILSEFFDNETCMDPQTEWQLIQQIMGSIPLEAVNATVAQMITEENMVILFQGPEKEGLPSPTEAEILDVLAKVRATDIAPLQEQEIATDLLDPATLKGSKVKKQKAGFYGSTEWTLKNGMKVILLPTDFEKDRISIELYKQGGTSLISDEDLNSFESNIWSLFMRNCGVSKYTSTEVTKMLSGKNVSVSPYFGALRHGINATTTVKDLETGLQLLYLMFTDPRFDPNEYEQGMKTINAVLPNLVNQPNYILQKQMFSTVYGDNPRNVLISEEVVNKASLGTIEKNYRRLFDSAKGATAVIVGDFKIDEIRPLVLKYLGSLPKGKKATKWVDDNLDIVPGNITNDFSVDMQTPMTTVLEIYKAPVPFSVKTEVALDAAQYILNMRYVTSLREDEGGTYGASTNISLTNAPKQYALLQTFFNCKPSSTDRLRELAEKDLVDLSVNGPTEEEFGMALKNLQKTMPERKITNSFWLNALRTQDLWGYDNVDAREAAIEALTADQIKDAVKQLLDGDNHIELVMRPGNTTEAE